MSIVEKHDEFSTARLPLFSRAVTDLFDWDGKILIPKGQILTNDLVSALQAAGIDAVYAAPGRHPRPERMERLDLLAIPEDVPVSADLFDREGRTVAHKGAMVAPEIIDRYRRYGHKKLYYFGENNPDPAAFHAAYAERIRKHLDDEVSSGIFDIKQPTAGVPLWKMTRVFAGQPRPRPALKNAKEFYEGAAERLSGIVSRVADGGYAWRNELAGIVDETLSRFSSEREVMLALAGTPVGLWPDGEHGMASAIYCVAITCRLGFNQPQARALAAAALFHDAGFALLPEELLGAERLLSKVEREEIMSHVDKGLFLLGRIDWPASDVALAIYQHHERGTGGGYPNRTPARDISEHARVLAVADVFHALITKRPHREALPLVEAAKRILKMARVGLLDSSCVAALAAELSLFPTGAILQLSNGEVARSVAPSKAPDRPWVGVISGANGEKLRGPYFRDLSSPSNTVSIVKELPQSGDPIAGL